MRNCVTIHGVWMYPPDAPASLIKLIRAGLLPIDGVSTSRFGLDQINEAVEYAAENPNPFQRTELWPRTNA
jgi:alcohol dehydrogenase